MAKKINLDESKLKELHSQGLSTKEVALELSVHISTVKRYWKKLGLIANKPFREKLSEQQKQHLSKKRKKWLAENPERHPWRRKDKFKSEPCEKAKEFLLSLGVEFIEEFVPEVSGRFFSIDIALPDKMIAIEINGNQHYERNGQLKPYYQERHELLESAGWIVYEIHYSACFNLEKWSDFINKIKQSAKKVDFDYFSYTPKTQEKRTCGDCGCYINPASIRCRSCNNSLEKKTKISWPSKEFFEKVLWEKPTTHIAKELGVSDNAVGKHIKKLGLLKPTRGFWVKAKETGIEPA